MFHIWEKKSEHAKGKKCCTIEEQYQLEFRFLFFETKPYDVLVSRLGK